MSSKKLRHREKLAIRKAGSCKFGQGNPGPNREMKRHPEKYGVSDDK